MLPCFEFVDKPDVSSGLLQSLRGVFLGFEDTQKSVTGYRAIANDSHSDKGVHHRCFREAPKCASDAQPRIIS